MDRPARVTVVTAVLLGSLTVAIGCPLSATPTTRPTGGPPTTATTTVATTVRLTVRVADLRNGEGDALVGVFRSADGFPSDAAKSVGWKILSADADVPTATFDLPPGRYAVGVLHDENKSGQMETGFLGIPKEGYGVSNNPKPRRRAATFAEATFDLDAGQPKTVTVSIQYDFL